jgi:hypothetical protein
MPTTVRGVYNKGHVELLENPSGVREGHVLVTLSEDLETHSTPTYLQFGKYSTGRMSTEEDFKAAEWHGVEEIDAD